MGPVPAAERSPDHDPSCFRGFSAVGICSRRFRPCAIAERAGFEPAKRLSTLTRFPVALLRPLGHLSGRAKGIRERRLALRGRDHVRGDVLICCSLSWSPNGGIAPEPLVTRSTTRAASGFESSRFGPTAPEAPAASSVWQPPQPAEAKTASPAAASPSAPPPASVVVPGSVSPVSVAVGLGRLGAVLLFLGREDPDTGHRHQEEQHRHADEEAEPVAREVRVAPREVERGEKREDDEEAGGRREPQLPPVRDSEQHAREPTTGDYARSRGAIVRPCPCSCSQ